MNRKIADKAFWLLVAIGLFKVAGFGVVPALVFVAGIAWCLAAGRIAAKHPTRPIPFVIVMASLILGIGVMQLSPLLASEGQRSGKLAERPDQIVYAAGIAIIVFGALGVVRALARRRQKGSSNPGESP